MVRYVVCTCDGNFKFLTVSVPTLQNLMDRYKTTETFTNIHLSQIAPFFHVRRAGMRFKVACDADICRLAEDEVLYPVILSHNGKTNSNSKQTSHSNNNNHNHNNNNNNNQIDYTTYPSLSSIPTIQQSVTTITTTDYKQSTEFCLPPKSPPCISLTQLRSTCCSFSEKKRFFSEASNHGHFYIDVDEETYSQLKYGLKIAAEFFQLPSAEKSKIPLDSVLRIWGWKSLDFKRKECLKIRDRGHIVSDSWRSSTDFPPLSEFRTVFSLFYNLGKTLMTALLSSVYNMSEESIDDILKSGPCTESPQDDCAASFWEMFRYKPFPDLNPDFVPVPCETHTDVGLMTLSMHSRELNGDEGTQGLQVYDWSAASWVDAETPMKGKKRLIGIFGEHLEYMTSGGFNATPHRVVLPSQSNTTRISQIFEILPHPHSFVPKIVSSSDGFSHDKNILSKDLFFNNSADVSSVNFE